MAGLVPAIHDFFCRLALSADCPHKAGHELCPEPWQLALVNRYVTLRNLDIRQHGT